MNKIIVALFDNLGELICRETFEFNDTENRKRKIINEHILYLLHLYNEEFDIGRIEIN